MIDTVDNPQLAGKVIRGGWFENTRLQKVGMDILARSNFTCRECGFVSRSSKKIPHGYMVPINLSHPGLAALSNKESLCLCPFCASAKAVNWSVVDHPAQHGEVVPAAGSLIWLPEMSQNKLSLISTYIGVSAHCMEVTHPFFEVLNEIDISFRGRSAHLSSNVALYKEDCDSHFAKALSLLPNEFKETRDETLKGVRFWPRAAYWSAQSRYWGQATYQNLENMKKIFEGM